MILLLIATLAAVKEPKATVKKVTTIDFEDVSVKAPLVKPSLQLVKETRRPQFGPLTPRPIFKHMEPNKLNK
jgi:hypothetical protein